MAQGLFDDVPMVGGVAPAINAQPGTPGLFDDIPTVQNVSTVADVVKGAGSGLVKGGVGLFALPGTVEQLGRTGINYVGEKFTGNPQTVAPQAALPGYDDIKGKVETNITGKLYEPKTTAGQYAQTIAEFAPGMLFPAGVGGMVARAGLNVVAPAVASETAGQLTKGTAAEPYARLAGGVVGGMLPGMAGRIVSPGATDPTRARMAQTLDQEGVNLTAGDRSGSRTIRWAESAQQDTPLAGQRLMNIKERQAEQFTSAALRRAGIQADRVTPEVIDQSFTRLGNEFDTLAASTTVRAPQAQAAAAAVQRELTTYMGLTGEATRAPIVERLAQDITNLAQRGSIDGAVYQSWRSQIDTLARRADAPTQQALYGFRNALDNAMQQSAPRDLAQRWQNVRREYRNMLVIEKAALNGGEQAALGFITPAQLRGAASQLGGRGYKRGNNEYTELATAGQALLTPLPNSGSPARLAVHAAGAGLGAMLGGPPGAAAGVIAPIAGQAIMGRTIASRPMQAYLGNQVAAPIANLPTGSRLGSLPGATASADVGTPEIPDDIRRRMAAELLGQDGFVVRVPIGGPR